MDQSFTLAIDEGGVSWCGRPIGIRPTYRAVADAIGCDADRSFGSHGGRRRRYVYDSLGLSLLVRKDDDRVYWLMVDLEPAPWRPASDHDPAGWFRGDLSIGGRFLPRPIRTHVAEDLRDVRWEHLSLAWTPHGRIMASVCVDFHLTQGPEGEGPLGVGEHVSR